MKLQKAAAKQRRSSSIVQPINCKYLLLFSTPNKWFFHFW